MVIKQATQWDPLWDLPHPKCPDHSQIYQLRTEEWTFRIPMYSLNSKSVTRSFPPPPHLEELNQFF